MAACCTCPVTRDPLAGKQVCAQNCLEPLAVAAVAANAAAVKGSKVMLMVGAGL